MSDRLQAMTAFVTVCDAGGFAAAARQLDVSPSVVTRLVASLETRIGIRLLQRTTRRFSLTEAGARYLDRTRLILADIVEAEGEAQDGRGAPRGLLVVSAPNLFGRLRIAPLVLHYLATYREVRAELRLTNEIVDLVENRVDIAIRVGDLPDSNLIARRLGWLRRLFVASPSYLNKHGVPRQPDDLARHHLIAFASVAPRRNWTFQRDGAVSSLRVEPAFYSDDGTVAIAHAIGGGGILPVLDYQVAAHVAAGRLTEVLDGYALPPVPVHVVYPSARLMPLKTRAFLDLLDATAVDWRFLPSV